MDLFFNLDTQSARYGEQLCLSLDHDGYRGYVQWRRPLIFYIIVQLRFSDALQSKKFVQRSRNPMIPCGCMKAH